jgi:O-acetylserine/cysteine efflux transporter
MSRRDTALATLAAVLWGFNLIAGKIGVEAAPPLLFTALRFIIVAALIVPLCPVDRKHWRGLIILSVCFGTGHFGLLFVGLSGVDAATAAITLQLGVPFSILISWLVFKENFGWRRSVGLGFAFIGVAFLAGEPGNTSAVPFFMLIVCTVFWAWSNVLVKRMPDVRPLAITGWLSLFAAPQLLALSMVFETGQLSAISIMAHATWYSLVQRYPMNTVVPFNMLIPIVGVAAGILVLGEPLTWQKVMGGVLTLAGVAVIQLRLARKAVEQGTKDAS